MLDINNFTIIGKCTDAKKISAGDWEIVLLTVDSVQYSTVHSAADSDALPPEQNIVGKILKIEGFLDYYEKKERYQASMRLGTVGISDKMIDPLNNVVLSGSVESRDGNILELSAAYYSKGKDKGIKKRRCLIDVTKWAESSGISIDKIRPGESSCIVTGKLKSKNGQVMVDVECLSPMNFNKLEKKQS